MAQADKMQRGLDGNQDRAFYLAISLRDQFSDLIIGGMRNCFKQTR